MLLPAPAATQESIAGPQLDISGLAFGDVYHVPSHHLPEGDGATGLVLRRAYLTFNAVFSPDWSGRLRFEANQAGTFETYDYEVDFKDLYLNWKLGRHTLVAGLTSTITYDVIESFWGRRYLVRTPMDIHGVPSRDTGLSLQGPLNEAGNFSYRAMLGTGIEFGADSADSTKWMGAVNWKPAPGWLIDLYADFEELSGPGDYLTLQGFAAFASDTMRWGAQYSHQDRDGTKPLEIASVFAVKRLGNQSSLVGRVDRLLEPSPRGNDIAYIPFDPTARATMLIAAWEYHPTEHLTITPNTLVIRYDRNDEGVRPETDVHLRLTLFINFE